MNAINTHPGFEMTTANGEIKYISLEAAAQEIWVETAGNLTENMLHNLEVYYGGVASNK